MRDCGILAVLSVSFSSCCERFGEFLQIRESGTGDAGGMKAAGPHLLMLGCETVYPDRDPDPGAGLRSELCVRKCMAEVSSGA